MISIFTYYNAINYGAVLQAYAMQEVIKEISFDEDVYIVDYCPQAVRDDYKLLKTGSGKALLLSLFNYRDNAKRRKVFDAFIEKYMCIINQEESKNASMIMLGSDQIWNPNISRGFDECFFGILNDNKKRRVGSYAASIGVSKLNESQFKELETLIHNVDYVSVREKSAKELIHEVDPEIDISVDLDPTLLVPREKWELIAKPIAIVDTPYILIYSLSGYPLTFETANKVADFYKARIIEVTIKNHKPFVKVGHQQIKDAGPDEFLWLIKNAAAVVTDSFHGTVFSIIFGRSLYVIPNKTKASRMIELMQKVELESRIITLNDQKLDFTPIKFSRVDELLGKEKSKSYSSMKSALGVNEIEPMRRV